MENLLQFVPAELTILIAVIYVLGMILKQMKCFDDKYINIMLLAISIAFAISIQGYTVNAVMYGVIVTGVATLVNQIPKQLNKGNYKGR